MSASLGASYREGESAPVLTHEDIRWAPLSEPLHGAPPIGLTIQEERRPLLSADLVIEELALSEAGALERVYTLLHDNQTLREMVSEALTLLTRESAHLDAARRTIADLRRQLRSIP
jgi:hypothetical protein